MQAKVVHCLLFLLFILMSKSQVHGQQIGIPVEPLEDGPWFFDTAEQHKIKVSVVARGMSHPWAIAFLPNGDILVTEREGKLRLVQNDRLIEESLAGVPSVRAEGNGGLMDVAIHPRFLENQRVVLRTCPPQPYSMVLGLTW